MNIDRARNFPKHYQRSCWILKKVFSQWNILSGSDSVQSRCILQKGKIQIRLGFLGKWMLSTTTYQRTRVYVICHELYTILGHQWIVNSNTYKIGLLIVIFFCVRTSLHWYIFSAYHSHLLLWNFCTVDSNAKFGKWWIL